MDEVDDDLKPEGRSLINAQVHAVFTPSGSRSNSPLRPRPVYP